MRKICVLFIIIAFCQPSLAVSESMKPEWNEFCPAKYCKATYKPHNFNAYYITGAVLTISIFGAPLGVPILIWNKKANNRNYWANRRYAFDKEIEACSQIENSDIKALCFIDIRKTEEHKSDILNGAYSPRVNVINNNYSY